jgi:hypothetical protein
MKERIRRVIRRKIRRIRKIRMIRKKKGGYRDIYNETTYT